MSNDFTQAALDEFEEWRARSEALIAETYEKAETLGMPPTIFITTLLACAAGAIAEAASGRTQQLRDSCVRYLDGAIDHALNARTRPH